jgi:hypothetical protein
MCDRWRGASVDVVAIIIESPESARTSETEILGEGEGEIVRTRASLRTVHVQHECHRAPTKWQRTLVE